MIAVQVLLLILLLVATTAAEFGVAVLLERYVGLRIENWIQIFLLAGIACFGLATQLDINWLKGAAAVLMAPFVVMPALALGWMIWWSVLALVRAVRRIGM